jgi:ketosteroid isomerase-like protein
MHPAIANQFIERLNTAFHEGDPEAQGKQAEARNIAQLEAQYRAIAEGNFAAVLGMLADDAELEILGPPDMQFAGRWQGRDRIGEALRNNFSKVADQEPRIESVTAQGDTVVILARERGRYVPTGRSYDIHFVQMFWFRDGKIVRVRQLADTASWRDATQPV